MHVNKYGSSVALCHLLLRLLVRKRSVTNIQSLPSRDLRAGGQRDRPQAQVARVSVRECAHRVMRLLSWFRFSAEPRLTLLVVRTRVVLLECREQERCHQRK